MNGSIIHRTIGGIAGTSNDPVMPSLRVAPATDQQHNTLRPRLVPLACWKVEDVRFEFDSSFPRPEIGQELPALGALIDQHTVDGVKPPVSLFGHADPVGDEEYNKKLSGRRAKAMYALLCRDVDKWEELYTQPLGGDNWQTLRAVDVMLYAVGYGASVEMVKKFQSDHGLTSDGVVGPNTRKALYRAYMDALCPFTVEKKDFLGGGVDAKGKGDYQGCSEFNPLLVFSKDEEKLYASNPNKTARNEANAPNRRVLALLFRPGVMVTPDAWPCPRADEGCAGCRKRFFVEGDARRSPTDERRFAHETDDTFACRFYHILTHRSPCERPLGDTGDPRGDAEGNDEPEVIDIDQLEELTREDLVSRGLIAEDEPAVAADEAQPQGVQGAQGLVGGANPGSTLVPITQPKKKPAGLPAIPPRHGPDKPVVDIGYLKDLNDGKYEWKGAYKADRSGFADEKLDGLLQQIGKWWFDGGQQPLDTTKFDGGEGFRPVDASGSGGGDTNSKDIEGLPAWLPTMQARLIGVSKKEFKGELKPYLQGTNRLIQAFLNTWVKTLNGDVHASLEEFFYHVGKSETNGQSSILGGYTGAADWCAQASSGAFARGLFRYGVAFAAAAVPGVNESEQTKYPILLTKFNGRFTKWAQKTDKNRKLVNVIKPGTPAEHKSLKLTPGDIITIVNGGRSGPLSGHVATVIKQVPANPTSDEPGTLLDTIYIVSGNAGGAANKEGSVRVEQIQREMPPAAEDYNYEEIAGVSNSYGIAKSRIPQLEKEIAILDIAIPLLKLKQAPADEIAAREAERDKKNKELAEQKLKMETAVKKAEEKNLPLNREDSRFKSGKHAPKDRGRSWLVSFYRSGRLDAKNRRQEILAGGDSEMQSGKRLDEMTEKPKEWDPQ